MPPSRGSGLRARWDRAFTALLLLVVVGGALSAVGTRLVVTGYRDTARQVETEASLLSDLQTNVVAHAAAALIDVGPEQLRRLEEPVRRDFRAALAQEPAGRDALRRAEGTWLALAERVRQPGTMDVLQAVTSDVPAVLAAVETTSAAARDASRDDLDRAALLERTNIATSALLVLVGLALVVRFARRFRAEVLAPVVELRDSADLMARGDLTHRVGSTREDELGDLARSFDAMAEAVAASQQRLTHTASHDSLTGLANRLAFRAALQERLAADPAGTCVVYLDLDGFKAVNDRHGHAVGDALLQEVARRLTAAVRPGDPVARLGGDEFALLCSSTGGGAGHLLADRAVAALRAPVDALGHEVRIGASAGVATAKPGESLDALLQRADAAMYRAKAARPRLPSSRQASEA